MGKAAAEAASTGAGSAMSRRELVRGIAAGAAALGMTGTVTAHAAEAGSSAVDSKEGSAGSGSPIEGFAAWAAEGGNAGSAGAPMFLEGDENRPTDDELTQMLETANTYFQCHGLTGVHFVVVKDPEEQAEIFKFMGGTGSGTVAVLCFADGLRDQDIHQEQYYPGMADENGGNPEYWHMPYALVELGWSLGYLNLAARELGYRMRTFGALNLPNLTTGEVDVCGTAGSFDYITRGMWDTDKYLEPKEGGEPFTHYTMVLDREIECPGNMTMVCACLIGRIDEVDAVSGATVGADYKAKIRDNFDFWDKD